MRELWWAAAGAWDHTAALICTVRSMVEKDVDMTRLNPYRRPRVARQRGPVSEAESAAGWAVLDRAFQRR